MKKLIIAVVLLLALAGGGWLAAKKWPEKFGLAKSSGGAAAKPTGRPTSAVVTPRNISFAVTAAGDIGPADQVSVRPEISGRIASLPVDIGDVVKKDQVLFTLDDRDLQIERTSRLTEIEGAKLQLERAKRNYDRSKELFENKLVSQELFENTKTEFELGKNSLERAMNDLKQLEDKLSRTKIIAPFDCTVLTRPVSVGQAVSGASGVNSGTEVLTIANLTEMIITAHINQADVTRLTPNQKVEIEVEAVPGLKLIGNVDRIAPQATVKLGIKGFSTRILLRNADKQVRPGMTANLTIPLAAVENALAVPLAAVFSEQGDRFVYVKQPTTEEDDEVKWARTPIQIGVADYDFAEVVSGLKGGETVSLVAPAEEGIVKPAGAFAKPAAAKDGKDKKKVKKPATKPASGAAASTGK